MTDSMGQKHRLTLPIGKMSKHVWDKQCAFASRRLPDPFAELISKTKQPFISSIVDIEVCQPSFFDGRILFVGDALVAFRPHVACSTNQAALDAILVGKLVNGEMQLSSWETRVMEYAHLTRLRSITWGSWYQFGYVSFFLSEARYLWAWSTSKISRYWQG